jgi:hypothetical protein
MGDIPVPTKIEQFNSMIRGSALSLLTLVFCYKFFDGTVSTDAFISIYAGVLGWWFATRGGQPSGTTVTTAGNGTTTTTTEPGGATATVAVTKP